MRVQLFLALLAIGLTGGTVAGAQGYQRSRPWHAAPYQGGYHVSRPHSGQHTPTWSGHLPYAHGGGTYHRRHVSGSYFQRPYPYHLDYYRMRYGGSYAPYFGNQYGVPQVAAPLIVYPPYGGGYGWSGAPGPLVAPAAESPSQE